MCPALYHRRASVPGHRRRCRTAARLHHVASGLTEWRAAPRKKQPPRAAGWLRGLQEHRARFRLRVDGPLLTPLVRRASHGMDVAALRRRPPGRLARRRAAPAAGHPVPWPRRQTRSKRPRLRNGKYKPASRARRESPPCRSPGALPPAFAHRAGQGAEAWPVDDDGEACLPEFAEEAVRVVVARHKRHDGDIRGRPVEVASPGRVRWLNAQGWW